MTNKGDSLMYEYRIETFSGRKTEDEVNKLALQGWRVIAVCPNMVTGIGLVFTFERERA